MEVRMMIRTVRVGGDSMRFSRILHQDVSPRRFTISASLDEVGISH